VCGGRRRILGHDDTGALRKRLRTGTLRGLAPHGEGNPTREWMASRPQVEAEAVNRGRITPPAQGETLADLRIQMLQGALSDAQQARLAQAEELITELRSRLAEKDARIAQLEGQAAALARSVADVLAVPATLTRASTAS
jgi:hypothetical protein